MRGSSSKKIASAFFGMLLLAVGIGAGVLLVLNPQLLNQRALVTDYQCINGCPSGYACDKGTGKCERYPSGAGNCANNKGDCYVTSGIGLVENPDGTNGAVCDTEGHWTYCAQGTVCTQNDCVPTTNPTQPPTTIAQCSAVKIYSPTWTAISASTFSTFKAGNKVYFCVSGTTNSTAGSFDKARFTINGNVRPETTIKRPGTGDFCDLYTIPATTYNFTVQGEIHHTLLGWQ